MRRKRDEPDGGGEAHAAPVTSKAALLAFLLLFTTILWGVSGTSRISMSFDRTGYHTIGHARPLRPNQRMGHFYTSTGIDWAPNYTVESRLEPVPVGGLAAQWSARCLTLETGERGSEALDTFEPRPLG